jgi:hypothetical protein
MIILTTSVVFQQFVITFIYRAHLIKNKLFINNLTKEVSLKSDVI